MYNKPSKSKHKSRDRWGPWSDWIWSPENSLYYRERRDANNTRDYEWSNPAAQDTADATVPRHAREDIDNITEGVQNLRTDFEPENSATQDPEFYAYDSGISSSKQSKGKGKNRKGKSLAYTYNEEEDIREEPPETREEPLERTEERRETGDETGDEPHYLDPFHGAHRNKTPRNASRFPTPGYDTQGASYGYEPYGPEPQENPDPNSAQQYSTEELPRREDTDFVIGEDYDSHTSEYSSSTSRRVPRTTFFDSGTADQEAVQDQDDAEYDAATARALQESRNMYQNMQEGSSSQTAYIAVSAEDEQGRSTPRASSPALDIRGTSGYSENLDPRYRVETSSRFQPGEVFKVLWSEPSGQVGGTPSISDWQEIRNQWGSFYAGFRRFIVIANDEGHCACVPILTYGGKGCKKRGVKPQKHGIIYEKGHRSRPLDNEPKLGFGPVRMVIQAGGEKLSRESRVNYSKLVTIEHNVKVFFIGSIFLEDWDIVRDAVNRCWEDKAHHRRKRQFQT